MTMTPEEFKRLRLYLKLTQSQMATMLGYTAPARVSEIETGRQKPPNAVARLMMAYVSGYRPDDWPK